MVQGMSRDAWMIFQSYFSEMCLIISLWNPFFLDPSESLKRIFAFSVGGLLASHPIYICLNLREEWSQRGGKGGENVFQLSFCSEQRGLVPYSHVMKNTYIMSRMTGTVAGEMTH